MFVDGHEQHLPARAFNRIALIARDAVPGANDAPDLPDVEMQKIAGRGVLVALCGLGGLKIREPGQALCFG